MIKFIKSNLGLTIVAVISAIIFISYEAKMDLLKIIPYENFYYNLASQLSLSFMGCFVFYIMQVYIPQKKEKDKINKAIRIQIDKILINLIEPIRYTSLFFLSETINDKYIADTKIEEISSKIDLFERSTHCNSKGETIPILAFINKNNNIVKRQIDSLYKSMGIYLDTELIELLDEIESIYEYDLFKRLNEYWIIEKNKNNFINMDDMNINPSKYLDLSYPGGDKDSIARTFKEYLKIYMKLKQYYMK